MLSRGLNPSTIILSMALKLCFLSVMDYLAVIISYLCHSRMEAFHSMSRDGVVKDFGPLALSSSPFIQITRLGNKTLRWSLKTV